jgi:hypothetical protein
VELPPPSVIAWCREVVAAADACAAAPTEIEQPAPDEIGESEAARLIGLTPDALRRQREREGGCPVVRRKRHGRRSLYFYNRNDFLVWAAKRGYRTTGLDALPDGDSEA